MGNSRDFAARGARATRPRDSRRDAALLRNEELSTSFSAMATILQNRLGSAWDPFDVTADGQRFLVNAVDQPQAAEPINVVVNWDAELKK